MSAPAVIAAWIVPGPVPAYHYAKQTQLFDEWPALAGALDALAADKPVDLKGPDLEAMPNISVVMDDSNDVWQKRGGMWCSWETSDHTSTRLARFGPFRVLHIGKA